MGESIFRNRPQFGKHPYILYRLPGENHFVNMKISSTQTLSCLDDISGDGFLFAPYNSKQHPMAWFTAANRQSFSCDTKLEIPTSTFFTQLFDGESVTKDMYIEKLSEIIGLIQHEKEIKKIVLSRSLFKKIESFNNFGPFFKRLMDAYPQSFVYLLNHPEFGTWCGASPELLFSSNNGEGATVALASTRKLEAFDDEKVQWNLKEVVEQQLVEQYIEDKIEQLGHQFSKQGPETILTGRLAHIRSYYQFNIPKKDQLNFINELHPTPAICGLPKTIAKEHLNTIEGYDREYYGGYLGPMGEYGTQLFVNLRCFKVFSNGLKLHAGGGITNDSIPELEWTETCNKLDSILRLL